MRQKQKGFTLFEMLVVVAIIGILLGIMSVSFSAAQARARDSKRIQDMNTLQKALESYYALCASYPVNVATTTGSPLTCNTTTLLNSWPNDPKLAIDGSWSYYNTANSPQTNDSASYCLCAKLENSGMANYSSGCGGNTKTHYCIRNLQ